MHYNTTSGTPETPEFVVFFSELSKTVVPISNGQIAVPSNVTGLVYAIVTSCESEVTDKTIVAGPAVLIFD